MKTIRRKIKRAKQYWLSLSEEDKGSVPPMCKVSSIDSLIDEITAAVFLSLKVAIVEKYLHVQTLDNKYKKDSDFITRSEFTEFIAHICMHLDSESRINDLAEKSKV